MNRYFVQLQPRMAIKVSQPEKWALLVKSNVSYNYGSKWLQMYQSLVENGELEAIELVQGIHMSM